ncbi:MAG: DUF1565 domain-containing protein [Thermoplasmatales archaeon]|nr:DUF1565 domain-containing protein [Thermoplasmatales archaeon]
MEGPSKKCIILGVVVLLIITGFTPCINASLSISKSVNQDNYQTSFSLNDNYEYVIITNEYLENSDFQRLIQHKSQYLTATIVTTEDILSNPDFEVNGKYGDATNTTNGNHWIPNGKEVTKNFTRFDETQPRIRNFLRFAYDEWQTKYVLLGGDVQIIPARKLRINETWWYTGTQLIWTFAHIRSDLYYAALDGTWNDDFDEFFGEASEYSVDDEADFIAELYIGRAPVDDKRDVKTFVDKVISFETSEKPENMLFHQAGLNQINDPDSSVIPENCYLHVPDHYVVYKLYQIHTTIDPDKYARHWQDPDKLIVLQVGSGGSSYYYMERRVAGDVLFTCDDIKKFDNTFLPVHMSISCNSGNFGLDHDCLAENMLLYPNAGPSACIFNSFFGVVSEDDAHKYSGEFIEQQFYEIFQNGTDRLGEIVTKSKYHFLDDAMNDLLYRWCYYTVYLLGDPETPLFDVRNEIPIIDEVFVDDGFNENTQGWGVTHFDNIADGIDAVANSGTVFVYGGNYYENLVINKPVNIIGEDKHLTKIIGDENGDVIKLYDEVTITGFTIKNSGYSSNAAGIKIYSQMNIIKDNTITENNYGIKFEIYGNDGPVENIINRINFVDNTLHAFDIHENRFFGNYWDDYTGSDSDGDGIGDSSHSYYSGKDLCPFMDESGWDSGVNHKPILPIITGPSQGKPNTPYSFDFVTADPDGDNVYIYIDMADGAFDQWAGPHTSLDVKNLLYYWEKKGAYIIRAKARDEYGAETGWVTHTLTIPRNKALPIHSHQLLEFMFKIFKTLRNLRLNL